MQDMKSYATVQKWIANVNRQYDLREDEWSQRLEVLQRFCEQLGENPDALISEALQDQGRKVDFMRRLNRLAKSVSDDSRVAHDWQNVVRSFFIHNGARVVVRPYETY
jgi:hypothetical protein